MISATCRQVFNGMALTPVSRLVPNLAEWLRQLASPDLIGPRPVVGDVGDMICAYWCATRPPTIW